MKTLELPLFSTVFLLLLWKTRSQRFTDIILTQSGPIIGTIVNFDDSKEVDQYLGIPFAHPPIGRLRFRKPYPVIPWINIRLMNKVAPACVQYIPIPRPAYDSGFSSEDCLYLNIWVPRSNNISINNGKIPVMFWIYGGAFIVGSNKIPVYNGLALAAKGNIVVVTVNFRISALGYFTTGTNEAPGNVGLYDVLEALKWVNRNIDKFGGDPSQVTLAGQSSGALTIGLFCVSPLTKGLFKRIIMESGSPAQSMDRPFSINLNKSQHIAEKLGCADQDTTVYNDPDKVVGCMRKKNALDIVKVVNDLPSMTGQPIFPTYGDEILPFNTRKALENGIFYNVDVLTGNTHDEGSTKLVNFNVTLFGVYGEKNPKINKNLGISLLKDIFKDLDFKDDIINYYLGNVTNDDYDKIREQVYTALGDYTLLCPTKYFAEFYSRFGNRVYYYYFVHHPSNSPFAEWLKAYHFAEVPFVFGKPLLDSDKYTKNEVFLSTRMIKIWSNFVKHGSPESPELSEYQESNWPLYSREDPLYVTLGVETKKGSKGYGVGPHLKNCDFYRPYFGFA